MPKSVSGKGNHHETDKRAAHNKDGISCNPTGGDCVTPKQKTGYSGGEKSVSGKK